MKVSVAMTTYNGEKFIAQQLDSLRNQTRPIDELIIMDDCSKDKTVEYVNEYIAKWNLTNWTMRVNPQNVGWVKNFHNCIGSTTGDVVFFCDQDDLWHLDKIEKIVKIFEEHEGANAVAHRTRLINGENEVIADNPERFPYNSHETGSLTLNKVTKKFSYVNTPGCTLAVRGSMIKFVKENLGKDREMAHDALYWKLATIMDSGYILDEALIDYRMHSSNASQPTTSNTYVVKKNEARIQDAVYFWNEVNIIKDLCLAMQDTTINPESMDKLEKNIEFNKIREDFLRTHKVKFFFKLIARFGYFRTYKMLVGDILAIIKK